jgi:hypothetical protein
VVNRAGFVARDSDGNVTHYYILPGVFRREVCAGFDAEIVAKALLDRGFLDPAGEGRLQKKPRIRGLGTVWVYAIKPSILGRRNGDSGDLRDARDIPLNPQATGHGTVCPQSQNGAGDGGDKSPQCPPCTGANGDTISAHDSAMSPLSSESPGSGNTRAESVTQREREHL